MWLCYQSRLYFDLPALLKEKRSLMTFTDVSFKIIDSRFLLFFLICWKSPSEVSEKVHFFADDVVLMVNDWPSIVSSGMLFLRPDGLLNQKITFLVSE